MATDRPRVRRGNVFGPPPEVARVLESKPKAKPAIITRNPRARAIPLEEPAAVRLAAPALPTEGLELTQQDALDLVYALTEAIEAANANVQRWHERGDPHRLDAALTQAQRLETLRARVARHLTGLHRRG